MPQLREDYLLMRSHALARQALRTMAQSGAAGSFGLRLETPASLASTLWEMHGDGRRFVTAVERSVLMCGAARQLQERPTPGVAQLACRIVRDASGVPAFERAVQTRGESVAGASPGECQTLELIARYRELLDGLGLIEQNAALGLLAQRADEVVPASSRVVAMDSELLTPQLAALFTRAGAQALVGADPLSAQVRPLDPSVGLSFAFPGGRYATAALVERVLQSLEGRVLITCADPIGLADALACSLKAAGKSVAESGKVSFRDTSVGRVLVSLALTLAREMGRTDTQIAPPLLKSALADVVLSPVSGCQAKEAREVDTSLRANRVLTRDEAIDIAGGAGEGAADLIDAALNFNAARLDVIEERVKGAFGFDRPRLAIELGAVAALREGFAIAQAAGVDASSVLEALQLLSVTIEAASQEGDRPDVVVTTLPSAALLEPGSFDALVALDLTSKNHPVKDAADAQTTLLSKLNIDLRIDPLARARWEFNRVLGTARGRVVLSRPLNDENAEPTYPCVVLEELVDCYRDDPSATDDIDNPYLLPPCLREGLIERGEEALFANAAGNVDAVQTGAGVSVARGSIADGSDSLCPPIVQTLDGTPVLSPSGLEAYLECPRKWFLARRLNAPGLDEQFTPLEQGNFYHKVLQRFHNALSVAGMARVTKDNLDDAREVMLTVFEEAREHQLAREPLSGRLVPANRIEEHDVDRIGRELASWVDFEAQLLSGFEPHLHEHFIEESDRIAYAGCFIRGCVDRVDVDGSGSAVVIDYKGSIGAEYNPRQKGALAPGKVQALVYASAIERQLGLHTVGALYISYRKQTIAGAWSNELRDWQLPGGNPKNSLFASNGDGSFKELLAQTEECCAWAVDRMMNGFVEPQPSAPHACRFCPAVDCPGRWV